MTLDQMFDGVPTPAAVPSIPVTGLQYDSRKLSPGEVFFAFPGERVDGHQFIPQALEKGAAAIVSERPPEGAAAMGGGAAPGGERQLPSDKTVTASEQVPAGTAAVANQRAPESAAGLPNEPPPKDAAVSGSGRAPEGPPAMPHEPQAGAATMASNQPPPGAPATASERRAVPWVQVRHGREALALAALNFYGHPDRRLGLTGVTGTNGKTTTVYLIDSILRSAGFVTARLGTIEQTLAGEHRATLNTTPESLDLVRIFAELLDKGGSHASFEVSSHALELRRVHGFQFHTAVFTNLTRDHLDFHGDMDSYAAAKRRLFEGAGGPVPRWAVMHHGDPWGRKWEKLGGFELLTYGMNDGAAIAPSKLVSDFDGLRFTASTPAGRIPIQSPLLGRFNVLNILAAIGVGLSYQLSPEIIAKGVAECRAVAGRFERVDEGQPFIVVVDYAHTDDALRNVIRAARELVAERNPPGRVITLFGCGGDRDRTKRPLMGEAAGSLSDLVVLTSDNPRSEDPLNIMNDALVGLQRATDRYRMEVDRALAIRKAIGEARAGDIVILAGKGHETYQVIGSRTIPFDDREVARTALRERANGG